MFARLPTCHLSTCLSAHEPRSAGRRLLLGFQQAPGPRCQRHEQGANVVARLRIGEGAVGVELPLGQPDEYLGQRTKPLV